MNYDGLVCTERTADRRKVCTNLKPAWQTLQSDGVRRKLSGNKTCPDEFTRGMPPSTLWPRASESVLPTIHWYNVADIKATQMQLKSFRSGMNVWVGSRGIEQLSEFYSRFVFGGCGKQISSNEAWVSEGGSSHRKVSAPLIVITKGSLYAQNNENN